MEKKAQMRSFRRMADDLSKDTSTKSQMAEVDFTNTRDKKC